jgi:coproporphyrinogen III oxidase-like Fe-S oxidoreductase
VCVYHLVLHEGLGTEWSKDPALLAARPDNGAAFAAWSAVRELLLARGFVQTTLTNFERADVHGSERRFRYEDCSFRPERYDGLGFGPSAITTVAGARPVKLVNPTAAFDYELGDFAPERAFHYEPEDLRLLHVTRTLPRLALDRDVYRAAFDRDVVEDHAEALELLAGAALVAIEPSRVALTPRGMFHADTVAGLLAWRRSQLLRRRPGLKDGRPWRQPESFMG